MSRRGRHGRHSAPGPARPAALDDAGRDGAAQRDARPTESRRGEPGAGAFPESRGPEPRAAAPLAPPASRVETSRAQVAVEEPRAAVAERPAARRDGAESRVIAAFAPVAGTDGSNGARPAGPDGGSSPASANGTAGRTPDDGHEAPRTMCTTAQLRRFIKSRPWVPMHELRRRFGIWGGDDDVSPIRVGEHVLFIGLPAAEAGMMAELLGGDVGYELSLDPETPVVVGVYPMRPVPRS